MRNLTRISRAGDFGCQPTSEENFRSFLSDKNDDKTNVREQSVTTTTTTRTHTLARAHGHTGKVKQNKNVSTQREGDRETGSS